MKGRRILLFAVFFIVATAFGDYEISLSTIDGGGGDIIIGMNLSRSLSRENSRK